MSLCVVAAGTCSGTLVLVYMIMLVVNIVLGLIFSCPAARAGRGLSSIISGTLVSPFLALVVTLVYYRLVGASTSAGGGPYGGYAQPPQYGGYAQPPQGGGEPYGGYQPPPQGGWNQPPQGGYQPPPQGGWNQPPQGGSEPPTQQVPRWDGPEQPR